VGYEHGLLLLGLGQDVAPGVYDGGVPAPLGVVARAGAVGRYHEELVLDGSRPEERAPVLEAGLGPLGGHPQRSRPFVSELAGALGEAYIEAYQGAPPAQRGIRRHAWLAGPEVLRFFQQGKQVLLALRG